MSFPSAGRVAGCSVAVLTLGCGAPDSGLGEPDPVASILLSPASALVEPGRSVRLSPTLRDGRRLVVTGRDLVWASSDSLVATVADGLVSGVREGFATITASVDGSSGAASITVQRSVAAIQIRPEDPTIAVGTTVQLVGIPRGGNGREVDGPVVYWSTADATIARVDAGKVRGLRPGVAEITATAGGRSAATTVTVVPNVSGRWTLTSITSDAVVGVSCVAAGSLAIVQAGGTFGGTLERTGSCSTAGGTVEMSGSVELAESALSTGRLDFLVGGQPRCSYAGVLSGPPLQATGQVSCTGDLQGIAVNLQGTWEMRR